MGVTLVYDGKTFAADQIYDCKFIFGNAMVAQDLTIDTLSATVFAPDNVPFWYIWTIENSQIAANDGSVWAYETGEDLSNYVYGTPIALYYDNELIGKFYVENIKRIGAANFQITATSAIGLLSNYQFDGGMYSGNPTSVKSVIDAMLSGAPITYTVASELQSVWVKGWLPAGNVRECLRQLLFSCGAAIIKGANGNPVFCFNQPDTAVPVEPNRIYKDNSSINYLTKYTKVSIIEHNYFASLSSQEKCIFDNTSSESSAVNDRIQFKEPMQPNSFRAEDANGNDITATAIITRHVNYVIVNGFCKVFGKPYVDAKRKLSENTGVQSSPNELYIEDATLLSDTNSLNTLKRLVNYYKTADEIVYSFVADKNIKPGLLVDIIDPYDFDEVTGFIKETTGNISSFIKADTTLVKGWIPKHLGNDYNSYKILTTTATGDEHEIVIGSGAQTWNVPAELQGKNAYVVYFGGAQGGTGGNNGSAGGNYSGSGRTEQTVIYYQGHFLIAGCGEPGNGGQGGTGGTGGHRPSTYGSEKLVLGTSYNITLGAGGVGGSAQTEGSAGALTTFNGHQSNQFELLGDYINIVDGAVYCKEGDIGHTGYAGGNGGHAGSITLQKADTGDTAINGGNPSNGLSFYQDFYRTWPLPETWVYYYINAAGGGAGGGSYGDAGGNAGATESGVSFKPHPRLEDYYYVTMYGGNGGNGANASTIPTQATLGNGGTGGDGGGGGGGAGSSTALNSTYGHCATGGAGGTGGIGGKGSDGFIIIYYQS